MKGEWKVKLSDVERLNLRPETVDLIYIDPPFGTGKNRGDYQDNMSLDKYENWIYEILIKLRSSLKSNGSIYVHVDWHMGARIRIILDEIMGIQNFRNEIVWWYGGGGASKKQWARKHDNIYFYSKTDCWTFNVDAVRQPYKWNKGQKRADGSIRDLKKGKIPDDVFNEPGLMPWSRENTGYSTQKPVSLLSRIISASSNPGDVVLDCFCGSGTTGVAAVKLGRRAFLSDNNPRAIEITEKRLSNAGD